MSEKEQLLDGGSRRSYSSDPPPYESQEKPVSQPPVTEDAEPSPPSNGCLAYIYNHRGSIPGYGLLKLARGSSVYSLYVLGVLLMVYLLNQLDRYTLPIVTTHAGYDLKYGDQFCMVNTKVSQDTLDEFNITTNITSVCTNEEYFYTELNETVDVK